MRNVVEVGDVVDVEDPVEWCAPSVEWFALSVESSWSSAVFDVSHASSSCIAPCCPPVGPSSCALDSSSGTVDDVVHVGVVVDVLEVEDVDELDVEELEDVDEVDIEVDDSSDTSDDSSDTSDVSDPALEGSEDAAPDGRFSVPRVDDRPAAPPTKGALIALAGDSVELSVIEKPTICANANVPEPTTRIAAMTSAAVRLGFISPPSSRTDQAGANAGLSRR